jgi:hypothetical protein
MEFLRTDNPARYQELKLRAADTILKYTQAPVAAHVPQTMVVHWLSSPPTNGSDLPPARNDVPLIELRADTVDDDDAPSS